MTTDSGSAWDPDSRGCPACDETFVVIDGSDWADYASHLNGHVVDLLPDDE